MLNDKACWNFRKTKENDWGSRKKQFEALKSLKPNEQLSIKDEIPEDQLSEEARNEVDRIVEKEKRVNREDLIDITKKVHKIFVHLEQ